MKFYQKDSPESQTSETLKAYQQISEDQTSLQHLPHANHLATKEKDKEHQTRETVFQVSPERSQNYNPNTLRSKMYPDCSTALSYPKAAIDILITSFASLPRSATVRNGLLLALECLDRPGLEKDCFWLDSPTALSHSGKGRPPGQSKLESCLRKSNIIQKNEVLKPEWLETAFSLPTGWSDPEESRAATELLEKEDQQLETVSIHWWLVSLYEESYTSTQSPNTRLRHDPSQVFLRDKEKKQQSNRVKNYSRRNKTRKRNTGEGSGYIKTIDRIKKGKLYQEHWYQWEIWSNGKAKRGTTYISQNKLNKCRSMDADKQPVEKILSYLKTNRKRKK